MAWSRREFTAITVAGAAMALSLCGCGQSSDDTSADDGAGGEAGSGGGAGDKSRKRVKLADQPFTAGPLDQLKAPGVYTQFRDTKAVFLVSDGKTLLAFNATCTHSGCTTNYEADQKDFLCPCHKSRFDLEGNVANKSPAKRPLERLAIALATDPSQGKVVQVDPTQRFTTEDQWSDPAASLKL